VVLDGVLGGDDQEGLGQRVGDAFDRRLAFAHRLQERRLGARRGPVDLVGQQDVGEDRAFLEEEAPFFRVVDRGAQDVGRQQVGRELDPLEVGGARAGQGLGQGGLADTRHVFHEHVATANQGHRQLPDDVGLAQDDSPQAHLQLSEQITVRQAGPFRFKTRVRRFATTPETRGWAATPGPHRTPGGRGPPWRWPTASLLEPTSNAVLRRGAGSPRPR
jgi:hypothetical protein